MKTSRQNALRAFLSISFLFLLVLFAARAEAAKEALSFLLEDVVLEPKESKTITVGYYPENALDKTILWTVYDEQVATISSTSADNVFQVTGWTLGTTTMTAWLEADPSVTANMRVTVVSRDYGTTIVEESHWSGGGGGCSSGVATSFPLVGSLAVFALSGMGRKRR